MTKYIDIKTKEIVVIVKVIDATTVRVKRLRDKKEYNVPQDELIEAN